jgi:hypothetical protein
MRRRAAEQALARVLAPAQVQEQAPEPVADLAAAQVAQAAVLALRAPDPTEVPTAAKAAPKMFVRAEAKIQPVANIPT